MNANKQILQELNTLQQVYEIDKQVAKLEFLKNYIISLDRWHLLKMISENTYEYEMSKVSKQIAEIERQNGIINREWS